MRRRTLVLTLALVASLTAGDVRAQDGNGEAPPSAPPEHRRDPFRPFLLDLQPEAARVPLTPLQQYELGQLTVSGVVWALNPPRAMLQDNNGMGYIVTPGTPIGRHGGVVRAIEPTRVIVEEKTFDYYGNEQVHETVLELPRDDKPQDTTARE